MAKMCCKCVASAISDAVRIKVKPRKCLTYKALLDEADATRTRNLRIDSPLTAIVISP